MKIIAKTNNDSFLVEVGRSEVARLAGFYFGGIEGCPKFKIGDEIKVSEMYDQLYKLAKRKDALGHVAADLRRLADEIEVHDPVVSGLAEGAKS